MFDHLGLLVADHGSGDQHDHDNHVGMWEAVKINPNQSPPELERQAFLRHWQGKI